MRNIDISKLLIYSSIILLVDCNIAADDINFENLIIRGYNQVPVPLQQHITENEFNKIAPVMQMYADHAIHGCNLVYFLFLNKLCLIQSNNQFWNLGGKVTATQNRKFDFKKLFLDTSGEDKPRVKFTLRNDTTQCIYYDEIIKLTIFVDNNRYLQDIVLKQYYSINEDIFSILDADVSTILRDMGVCITEVTNNDLRAQRYAQYFTIRSNNQYKHYYIYIVQQNKSDNELHNQQDNEPQFEDCYDYNTARDNQIYRHRTKLLFTIDFSEDNIVRLYTLVTSNFFSDVTNAQQNDHSVDRYNFFETIFSSENSDNNGFGPLPAIFYTCLPAHDSDNATINNLATHADDYIHLDYENLPQNNQQNQVDQNNQQNQVDQNNQIKNSNKHVDDYNCGFDCLDACCKCCCCSCCCDSGCICCPC